MGKIHCLCALFLVLTSQIWAASTTACPAPKLDSQTFGIDRAQVIARAPHYTQGLVYWNGSLYESTGVYTRSRLYQIKLPSASARVIHYLPLNVFGEGLAHLNGLFYQLTWKSGKAFVYTDEQINSGRVLHTSELQLRAYKGEGWGLSALQNELILSDGTHVIQFLNPQTWAQNSQLNVRNESEPAENLNELEVVNGKIYANLWDLKNRIFEINPETGCVETIFDIKSLYEASFPCSLQEEFELGRLDPYDYVPNGIAYDPVKRKLYLTGKNWPKIFVFQLD